MELPIFQQPTPKSSRVWDQYVPVITNRHHTEVYLTDQIDEPSEYNEMCAILRNAERGDTVSIYINTPGGMIDSAFMIVDAIKNSKATVTAHLAGTVASAGTIIALSCDKLVVADHTGFMIHNYSAGLSGKGHEMKARQKFMDDSLNEAFTSFYKGFLTDDEIDDVIGGKDLWMGKTEVVERWQAKLASSKRQKSVEE